jgi:hypothetical protein
MCANVMLKPLTMHILIYTIKKRIRCGKKEKKKEAEPACRESSENATESVLPFKQMQAECPPSLLS